MGSWGVRQYRVSRALGRGVTRAAAILTLGRMPPFVSTSALVVQDDAVLVVIDPVRQEPVLPGGHLRWTEEPHAAVVREVREETGYHIEPDGVLGVFAGPAWAGEQGVVRVVYAAGLVGGALSSSAEGEARWMSLAELADSDGRDAPLARLYLERRKTAAGELNIRR